MSITLTVGSTTLTLPGGLQWPDRDWAGVVASGTRVFGGAYVQQVAAATGGRPITLTSGPDYAYLTAAQRTQLLTWAATPGQQMTLASLRGEPSRTVVFRHEDSAGPLTCEPVDRDNDGHTAERWRVTIRLVQVG